MAWKLEIHFSDGSSELVDEDFETEQDAQDEHDSCLLYTSPSPRDRG